MIPTYFHTKLRTFYHIMAAHYYPLYAVYMIADTSSLPSVRFKFDIH